MSSTKPGIFAYIAYCYTQRRLPDSMREWVAHDLAGAGAIRRFMVRAAIPPLLLLAPLWLLPVAQNALYVHVEMTVPIYAWALVVSFALNKVWRRHRLAQHGLDPNLVDVIKRKKNAKMHEDYIRRYGPRSDPADVNTNPFF